MPLDLLGKRHRAVYVRNCNAEHCESLATLMMRRCGAVEAWDVEDERMVIVFERIDSISNALMFNGMNPPFDLTSNQKLMVWRVNDPPPVGSKHQLALTVKSSGVTSSPQAPTQPSSSSSFQTLLKNLESEVERAERREMEDRDKKMLEWCYRQVKALNVLLEVETCRQKEELKQQQLHLRTSKSLLETLRQSHEEQTRNRKRKRDEEEE